MKRSYIAERCCMKKITVFFLFLLFFLICFRQAAAGPEEVKLILQSRYYYYNVDGYGFYDKCGSTSWFAIVLQNTASKPYTLSISPTAHLSTKEGTVHPLGNFRYKIMDEGSANTLRPDRPEIPYSGDLTLPAKSTYAVFIDVQNIERYNLYWDTTIYFTIQVTGNGETSPIHINGVIAQRGNACPADQVCSAVIKSAN